MPPAEPEARPRVCLDLNVFVAAEIALAKGNRGTTPLRLLHACRAGRFQLVVSRAMLDRLTEVLRREPLSLSAALAIERTELIAELAALSNLLVIGGGVLPIPDLEDRGVLEAAFAGGAHYLATYNLADYEPVTTSGADTALLRVRNTLIVHPHELVQRLGLG